MRLSAGLKDRLDRIEEKLDASPSLSTPTAEHPIEALLNDELRTWITTGTLPDDILAAALARGPIPMENWTDDELNERLDILRGDQTDDELLDDLKTLVDSGWKPKLTPFRATPARIKPIV